MGYLNPLVKLPAMRQLLDLPAEQRRCLAALFRDLRAQANDEAERSWKRRKGPMAAYWRAVATYARHVAHLLDSPITRRGRLDVKASSTPRMPRRQFIADKRDGIQDAA